MTYESIVFEKKPDGVVWLTLNRPQMKNAMNGVMYDEARSVVAEVDRDPDIRVLVLTGSGSAFCSGGDFEYQKSQAQRPHADSQACVPGLPTAVTVTTSYFSTAFATVG